MEKFQNRVDLDEHLIDFFEYLLPRLFPNWWVGYEYMSQLMNLQGAMTYPDIETVLDQHKGKSALGLGEADPDLAVHEEAVVQICDPFPHTTRAPIDVCVLLPLSVG